MARDPNLEECLMRRGALTRIARALDISPAAVSQWRRVPAKHLAMVALVTGWAPADLRPDLYPQRRKRPAKRSLAV